MNRIVSTLVALVAVATLSAGALAQDSGPSEKAPGPPGRHQRHKGNMIARMARELNLTDAQKQQLEPIMASFKQQAQARRESMMTRFQALLTPEQQAQLEKMKGEEGGKRGHRGGFRQLNLTEEQKAQMKALREEARTQGQADFQQMLAQVNTVLTPEQQARLQELIQERQARMEQRRAKKEQRRQKGETPQQ